MGLLIIEAYQTGQKSLNHLSTILYITRYLLANRLAGRTPEL